MLVFNSFMMLNNITGLRWIPLKNKRPVMTSFFFFADGPKKLLNQNTMTPMCMTSDELTHNSFIFFYFHFRTDNMIHEYHTQCPHVFSSSWAHTPCPAKSTYVTTPLAHLWAVLAASATTHGLGRTSCRSRCLWCPCRTFRPLKPTPISHLENWSY